jgi:hypothetical protein
MLNKDHKVLAAIFGNPEQTIIRAEIEDGKNQEVYEITTSSIDGDPVLWDAITDQLSLEQIAEQTREHIARQRQFFAETIAQYAMDNNMIYDPGKWNPNTKLSIDHIFTLPDGDAGSDFLFELKLRVFDLPTVAESADQSIKVAIREAESPLEVFYHAGKILFGE